MVRIGLSSGVTLLALFLSLFLVHAFVGCFAKAYQGNNHGHNIKRLQDQAHDHSTKRSESGGLGVPRSSSSKRLVHLQDSKEVPTRSTRDSTSTSDTPIRSRETYELDTIDKNKLAADKLLEAAEEIVNLMHKDYKGFNRPRSKPPINNHVPLH